MELELVVAAILQLANIPYGNIFSLSIEDGQLRVETDMDTLYFEPAERIVQIYREGDFRPYTIVTDRDLAQSIAEVVGMVHS